MYPLLFFSFFFPSLLNSTIQFPSLPPHPNPTFQVLTIPGPNKCNCRFVQLFLSLSHTRYASWFYIRKGCIHPPKFYNKTNTSFYPSLPQIQTHIPLHLHINFRINIYIHTHYFQIQTTTNNNNNNNNN